MTPERERLIERAAIIEEGQKITRWLAERTAAQQHGYADWHEAMRATK